MLPLRTAKGAFSVLSDAGFAIFCQTVEITSAGKFFSFFESVFQMNKIRIAVIGAGVRAKTVLKFLLEYAKDRACVTRIFETDQSNAAAAVSLWGGEERVKVCATADEAINAEDIDLVMIFTPNIYHKDLIIKAFKAGKRVFSEKPLATTVEDCLQVVEAQKQYNGKLLTGFVLRYSPLYRKVKELLESGTFGKIINIAASENRVAEAGGSSIAWKSGWRRSKELSGPHLLEKCSHDFDLLNWFNGSLPTRVAGFGGLDYFKPEHQFLMEKYGEDTFVKLVPPEKRVSPFTAPKDIKDNHAVILEYPNGAKVTFQLTLANAIHERRMYISCTEGTLIPEFFTSTLRYKRYSDQEETFMQFPVEAHGGSDVAMVREMVDGLLSGDDRVSSSGDNGLDCAITALAAEEAIDSGAVININEFTK